MLKKERRIKGIIGLWNYHWDKDKIVNKSHMSQKLMTVTVESPRRTELCKTDPAYFYLVPFCTANTLPLCPWRKNVHSIRRTNQHYFYSTLYHYTYIMRVRSNHIFQPDTQRILHTCRKCNRIKNIFPLVRMTVEFHTFQRSNQISSQSRGG